MYLTIDIGNSATKLVLFEQDEIVFHKTVKTLNLTEIKRLVKEYSPEKSILSSVARSSPAIISFLKMNSGFVKLDARSKIPIRNRYQTPKTLGNDRLASVIGAASIFSGKNALVIDAGTCIKYDFISASRQYFGGSISPGLHMRYLALNTFTGKLPLVEPAQVRSLIGRNTRESILTGVELGIENEKKGFIKSYQQKFHGLKMIMTGGDAARFAKRLKLPIFAAPHLVNIGLKEILKFHDSKE